MFAGFGTGGIPGSGSDRSAIGLATRQISGALEAERTGASRPALEWSVRAGAVTAGCDVGQKIITPAAITVTTATDTLPNHTARRARWPAGQPSLPIPILPARPGRAALVLSWYPQSPRSTPETLTRAGDYAQDKAVNHSPFGPEIARCEHRQAAVNTTTTPVRVCWPRRGPCERQCPDQPYRPDRSPGVTMTVSTSWPVQTGHRS